MSGREVRNRCCASWQLSASSISYPCCSRKSRIPNLTPDSSSTTNTLFRDISVSLNWYWESRDHTGSAIGIVAGNQFSAMFLHNSLGDCQAEAGASSSLRKERLEDLWHIFGENSSPTVPDCTLDPLM